MGSLRVRASISRRTRPLVTRFFARSGRLGGHRWTICSDRRLDANDFNRLTGVNVVRDTLRWLDNPQATREQMDDRRWAAFRDEARRELRFDPGTDMDVEAGRRLAEGRGRWGDVWLRFSDAPGQFPGVAEVLGRSRPGGELPLEGRDRWPDLNADDEAALRNALSALPDLTHTEACRRVQELEEVHGHSARLGVGQDGTLSLRGGAPTPRPFGRGNRAQHRRSNPRRNCKGLRRARVAG